MDQDILGKGMAFPVKPSISGGLPMSAGNEKVRQSIFIILSTAVGERQMRPEFGCGIHELVFEPNTPLLWGMVRDRVRRALTRWEPRIDLLDVRVEAPPDQRNYLLIRIDYRIRSNNTFFNLVYPFFINEGNS